MTEVIPPFIQLSDTEALRDGQIYDQDVILDSWIPRVHQSNRTRGLSNYP